VSYREIFVQRAVGMSVSAVQWGPLVYAPRLLPLTEPGASLPEQLESVLRHVRSVVTEAGGGMADLARVTLFLGEVKDRTVLNEVWRRWFPDPARRPPHKYLPADIPGGYAVMADAVAVLGGDRRVLSVPGLEHRDPMSIGARTGNLVFSSRLFVPVEDPAEDVESQLARLLGHATTLMQEAGGGLRDLTQVTLFLNSPDTVADVEAAWLKLWAATGTETAPDLHVVVADLGGSGKPRMEVTGVITHV
jgi:enamine deaminase RidA (YjgF/YER057c/UK114 family)